MQELVPDQQNDDLGNLHGTFDDQQAESVGLKAMQGEIIEVNKEFRALMIKAELAT